MSHPRRVRRRAFPTAPVKPPNSARNQLVKVSYFLISSPFILLCLSAYFPRSDVNVNYYCGDVFFFFVLFFSFDSLACHIW